MQSGQFEEFIQENVGIRISLYVYHDAHTLTARLIVYVGNAVNFAFLGKVGNRHDELLLVYTVRNLGDYNLVVVLTGLDFGSGTHHDSTSTCIVSVLHALDAVDGGTCREVRSWDILHQSVGIDVRVVDVGAASVNHLAQVVGRDIGSHTHGNTVTAVYQQVRNLGRHHGRLLEGVVEVVHHIHCLLVEVVHDVLTHLRESALRVTHRRRRVTIHGTEVTLSVDEGVTHVPLLTHTNQGTIYRRVAVRVVLTEHLTYHARTFLIRFVTGVSNTEHTVKNTAMHRLETIAHIREGTSHDHRHRIVDVTRLHLLLNVDLHDSIMIHCLIFVHFLY